MKVQRSMKQDINKSNMCWQSVCSELSLCQDISGYGSDIIREYALPCINWPAVLILLAL